MFMLHDILLNEVIYSEFPATNSELNKLLFVMMVKFSSYLHDVQMPVS